jgi:hypothetical protein
MGKRKTSVFRVVRRDHYIMVDKAVAKDPRLSPQEVGFLLRLLAKPSDWIFYFSVLARENRCSEKKARDLFNNLQEHGYALVRRVRNRKSGAFIRTEKMVFESPDLAAKERSESGSIFEIYEYPYFERTAPVGRNPPSGEPTMWDTHQVDSPLSGFGPSTELTTNRSKDSTERMMDGAIDGASGGPGVSTLPPGKAPLTDAPDPSSSSAAQDSFVVKDGNDPVGLLVAFGFAEDDARRQIARRGADMDRVRLVLRHAARRKPSQQRGFIVKALREGWVLDDIDNPAMDRTIDRKRVEATQQREDEERAQAMREQDDALASLSPADWESHIQALLPTLPRKALQMAQAGQGKENNLIRAQVYHRIRSRKAVPA